MREISNVGDVTSSIDDNNNNRDANNNLVAGNSKDTFKLEARYERMSATFGTSAIATVYSSKYANDIRDVRKSMESYESREAINSKEANNSREVNNSRDVNPK
jgi:hypothetical protein